MICSLIVSSWLWKIQSTSAPLDTGRRSGRRCRSRSCHCSASGSCNFPCSSAFATSCSNHAMTPMGQCPHRASSWTGHWACHCATVDQSGGTRSIGCWASVAVLWRPASGFGASALLLSWRCPDFSGGWPVDWWNRASWDSFSSLHLGRGDAYLLLMSFTVQVMHYDVESLSLHSRIRGAASSTFGSLYRSDHAVESAVSAVGSPWTSISRGKQASTPVLPIHIHLFSQDYIRLLYVVRCSGCFSSFCSVLKR